MAKARRVAKPQSASKAVARPATYWVTRRDQLEALVTIARTDILDRLVAHGALSVRELAAALGMRPTAIYHHLRVLEDVELVRATETRAERGRPAALYEAAGSLVRLARAPAKPENRPAMARIAKSLGTLAAKDYAKGLASPEAVLSGPKRNHWLFRCVQTPSPARLARINALFDELAELLWTPDPEPGDTLVKVAWFLSPGVAPRSPKKRRAKG